MASTLVNTEYGPVEGFDDTFPLSDSTFESAQQVLIGKIGPKKSVRKWLGIPYAQAERWRMPKAPEQWEKALDCFEFGSQFPQPLSEYSAAFRDREGYYVREFIKSSEHGSHTLNIFAPGDLKVGEKVPVLVWIYGGSLNSGSADVIVYDPSEWIRSTKNNRFIIVTFNYRLNIFGFFSGPDLLTTDGSSGNYGAYDCIEVFQWIQRNGENFGMDINRVTAFGESAGAFLVSALLVSKQKLFQRAIMQSGAPGSMPIRPVESAYLDYSIIISLCGFESATPNERIAGLRSMKWEDLYEAHTKPHCFETVPGLTIEGSGGIWTEDISKMLERGECDSWITEVLIGTNEDEGSVFSMGMSLRNTHDSFKDYLSQYYPALEEKYLEKFPPTYYETLSPYDHLTSPTAHLFANERFIFPANRLINQLTKNEKMKVFVYRYRELIERLVGPVPLGSMHSMELVSVFNTSSLWAADSPESSTAAQMGSRWVEFATNGIPGKDWIQCKKSNPTWLAFNHDGKVQNEAFDPVTEI